MSASGPSTSIPVVDVSSASSAVEGSDPVVQQIHDAFTTVGFVFITGHGIPRDLIEHMFMESRIFFTLPLEAKMKYHCCPDSKHNGYVSLEEERHSMNLGDLKEFFNVTSIDKCAVNVITLVVKLLFCHNVLRSVEAVAETAIYPVFHSLVRENFQRSKYTLRLAASLKDLSYPDREVPNFQPVVRELFQACNQLTLTLLEIIGHCLKLEDPHAVVQAHRNMGKGAGFNLTTLRLLYYPPLPPDSDIKPGQLRCGEHVDYGSITLLFQDPSGGLQVRQKSGEYIDVPYRGDAVLVNLGAMAENWTKDIYPATPHRVLLPAEESEKRSVRQSLAFFCHPDNEAVVQHLRASNKLPLIIIDEDGVHNVLQ